MCACAFLALARSFTSLVLAAGHAVLDGKLVKNAWLACSLATSGQWLSSPPLAREWPPYRQTTCVQKIRQDECRRRRRLPFSFSARPATVQRQLAQTRQADSWQADFTEFECFKYNGRLPHCMFFSCLCRLPCVLLSTPTCIRGYTFCTGSHTRLIQPHDLKLKLNLIPNIN